MCISIEFKLKYLHWQLLDTAIEVTRNVNVCFYCYLVNISLRVHVNKEHTE
jgi:hypothetical protein